MSDPFQVKIILSGCILFYCVAVFADVSRQGAHDFAVRCVGILRSDEGPKIMEAFISAVGGGTAGRIGWWESFWFSETRTNTDCDLKKLNIERVFIREPDSDSPAQVQLADGKSAKCLVLPEKIAVVYLGNAQKDIRAVLVMPLVSRHGKTMLCPMVMEQMPGPAASFGAGVAGQIPTQKTLAIVPGVEIIKVGDDDNSYGFPWPKPGESKRRTFDTNPLGCSLRQIILRAIDSGTWVKGLNRLPSGRFRVHCELSPGEVGTVEGKLLNAIAGAFDLNIKMEDACLLNGYQVTPPSPLPDCFKITKDDVGQSAMHRIGDYEGYSLNELLSNALHQKPMELVSTNTAERYDVQLEVWPEADGEMVALEQLGFKIDQIKLPKRTLIISSYKR